jgi:chromosome segregation ATPase
MSEHKKDPRQIDLVEYIEDAENGGPPALEKTLTDEELDGAGMVAVKAFIRSKASKNALRVAKAKKKREEGENGPARKQLNLQAPVSDDAREILKELNSAMLTEALTPEDIRDVLSEEAMDWKQRTTDVERERDQLRQQLEETEAQLDAAHRQIDELAAQIKRHRLDWLGWPLNRIFGRR